MRVFGWYFVVVNVVAGAISWFLAGVILVAKNFPFLESLFLAGPILLVFRDLAGFFGAFRLSASDRDNSSFSWALG